MTLWIFSASASTYEFMSYNVQNLFDSVHDKGKNDWAFLPKGAKGKEKACAKIGIQHYRNSCFKTDWTETKLKVKLSQIKQAILGKRAVLPHFLGLSEVENSRVVSLLAKELGYKEFRMTKGPDKRGIDLALLYNPSSELAFETMREHEVLGDYFKKKPTRSILEVEFKVGIKKKQRLTVFVNHWPSLGNPTKARLRAARVLKRRVDQILAYDSKHLLVAMGDFNTIPEDFPHPFKTILTKRGGLWDVHEAFMSSQKISKSKKQSLPPGSFFYGKKFAWNLLDRIFISRNLLDGKGAEVDLQSYQIYAPSFLTDVYEYSEKASPVFGSRVVGVPKRYNHNASDPKKAGYSDHFPIVVKIKL